MPLFLVRHASAGSRGSLGHASDLDRTLDEVGHEQAQALIDLLGDRGITEVYSSSAIRCVETIEPLANHLSLSVTIDPCLLEGQSATLAIHLAQTLARNNTTAALCTHGDIIPDLIQTLARQGLVIIGQRAWAKGSTWELRARGGDLTEAQFLGPY